MALCLDLFLAANRYDAAAGQDPRAFEWPPHPARIGSALRAVAEPENLPTLRAWEALPAPTIRASSITTRSVSRAFVVTNKREPKGGHQNHPGRTSGLRERRSVFPLSPRVQMIWPEVTELTVGMVEELDALARRVPYLGRSTSVVLMGFQLLTETPLPPNLDELIPVQGVGDLQLRVAYPGYMDELSSLYDIDAPAWQASDNSRARQSYAWAENLASAPAPSPEFVSPYQDLIVLRFQDARPDGRLIGKFTAALRSKVMKETADPIPLALHGHGYDGNPHVAYLGLPICGHEHSDGRLVGLAVAIPGMDGTERRRILRGILGSDVEGSVQLQVLGLRDPIALVYRPDEPLPKAATAQRWLGPSKQWVSATPVVLDRYPKDGDLASAVADTVELAGLPRPLDVEVSKAALTPGAVHLAPSELPRRAKGRLYCHARLRFAQNISGPVIAGAGRYFGVGLFAPEALS